MATATLRPVADGNYDGLWLITTGTDTGTAGVGASYIDESSPDDSGYIRDNDTTGSTPATDLNRHSVTLDAMPAASAISAVDIYYRARSNFNGGSIVPFVRSGGTDYDGSPQALTNAFVNYGPVDFFSVVSWTDTLVNSMELGFRKNAFANNETRVSQAYVVVTYTAGGTPLDMGSATAALAFGATGTIISIQPLIGTSALTFGATGAMNRVMGLAASAAMTFAGTGSMNRLMGMAGSSAITFGATAPMSMLMGLAGTSSLIFNADGSLTIVGSGGTLDMGTATAAMTFGATASMRQVMGLTGASAITFGATANPTMRMGMAGTSAMVFGAGASISMRMLMGTASAAMVFTATGTLIIPSTYNTRSKAGARGTMGRVAIWVPNHSRGGVHRA